ncbi:cytochrome P450 [Macroventuria anomochaeta]|uniref:Cytochrome P450 n=1 Tax=Macroventuria anomochaeta TaxID=301207 RepID=A0ACB6RMJ1_9PLEO|nr:cytochrome P450 [Macroventuria anomochaeta]KAF2623086.1 cytochrome P450 [Macroventuria anomochaeta]
MFNQLLTKAFLHPESTYDQRWVLFSILSGVVMVAAVLRVRSKSNIPVINKYSGDFFLKKAHTEYLNNAKALIAEGNKKFDGPFRVLTTLGSRVILPPRFTDWAKNCKDLDHPKLVADEYFARYPGFDGSGMVVDPGRMMINITKTKLSQSSQCNIFNERISGILEKEWTNTQGNWRTVDWALDAQRYVGLMSAPIFAGPELANDPQWHELTVTYTINLFNGVRALRAWPPLLRPIVHWILPECSTCRAQVKLARNKLKPVLEKRAHEKKEELAAGRNPTIYEDAITWSEDLAAGRPVDHAAMQLAFAISAMHTTTELLRQALLDICAHPYLIQPLREEAEAAVAKHGWTTAGLSQMQLLDSVVKETQRLKPGSLVNLERKALEDIVMPNGTILPKGTNIAMDTSVMWDPTVYLDPETYDGYRFYNNRHGGGPRARDAQLVSTSSDFIAFGLGKPVCPGRFFAANEIKVALANILMRYDVRLPDGAKPRVLHYGFEMLSDPSAKVEVKRRITVK